MCGIVGSRTDFRKPNSPGKERDSETGLDYFGARYYSNGLGRFITPDWSSAPVPVPYATFSDPQSLNQYSYVRNIPTTRFDADGHKDGDCGWFCRVGQRFHNANVGLGFRTNAEVTATAKKLREAAGEPGAGGELVSYDPKTKTTTTYTPEQLGKLDDAGAVKLYDQLFPDNPLGDEGSGAAQALAPVMTTFGWSGSKPYTDARNQLEQAGTHETLNGKVPTRAGCPRSRGFRDLGIFFHRPAHSMSGRRAITISTFGR